MLWKSLVKEHKDLSLSQVDEMIDLTNIAEISTLLAQLGGQIKRPFPMKKK